MKNAGDEGTARGPIADSTVVCRPLLFRASDQGTGLRNPRQFEAARTQEHGTRQLHVEGVALHDPDNGLMAWVILHLGTNGIGYNEKMSKVKALMPDAHSTAGACLRPRDGLEDRKCGISVLDSPEES